MNAYQIAKDYLASEFFKLGKEGYASVEDMVEATEALNTMSASELMEMYKVWRDSDV